jgi:ribonuclease-3
LKEERTRDLVALAARLGHEFADLSLLDQALTHTSHAHEEPGTGRRHNESLEFLGDAVLGFAVAELLHHRHPEGDEGTKSKARAHLVAAPSLARRALALGLPSLLRLGRGEEKTGGRAKTNLWADAYEAVVAALYLDGGLPATQRFIASQFAADVSLSEAQVITDAKSALQEWLQARGADVPEYVVVAEEGPSHRKQFRVQCVVEGKPVAEGVGTSKKIAHQDAALKALRALLGGE